MLLVSLPFPAILFFCSTHVFDGSVFSFLAGIQAALAVCQSVCPLVSLRTLVMYFPVQNIAMDFFVFHKTAEFCLISTTYLRILILKLEE